MRLGKRKTDLSPLKLLGQEKDSISISQLTQTKYMIIGIDASRAAKEEKTGTENYSWNLIKSLSTADTKNRYVLYFNKIPPFFEIGQNNFSSKRLSATKMWTQGRLALECLIMPPDILFVPAHTIPVIRRPPLRTIVTVHDLGAEYLAEYHKFPQKLYLNWSTRFVSAHATHIIAVSRSTKKDLIKRFNVSPDRISVVYEGVDKKLFYPRSSEEISRTRAKYGLSRKYLLFVGTIQPRKNLARLVEAFAKAKLRATDLVLVGSRGWLADDIYAAPKKFGVENKVKFAGFVPNEDLPSLYNGAAGFVYPSLYEGFGLPILEAFCCKCPVLTSKNGATGEVAKDAAVLIDPNDTNTIALGLKKLATDQNLQEKLIEKGTKRAEDFSWEKTAKDTIKVFEKVYQGNKK